MRAALRLLLLAGAALAQEPYFSGTGDDAALAALNAARALFDPSPTRQDLSWLYTSAWNGLVEGPTWDAWWTQNSYGFTLCAAPFLEEPLRTFVYNANALWFQWEGNGTIVGLDDPNPAPDGCLCDAAKPSGAYYKQGDGNVPIHDWALEETLSGVIMQAELLLVDRSAPRAAAFIPLFARTLRLIESRRDNATQLLLAGTSSNLLAPSYGAWLHANGTRTPAFLTGLAVSYVAALDRVIELELLAGFPALAAEHSAARAATLAALPQLLDPTGSYFVKWADPNGTLHGVLGQSRHGYIEAVVNHDAIALGVAERVRPGLSASIMAALLGPRVPPNPATGGQGLRPHAFVLTQAGGLDDMELPDTSWLWQYGTWVNGGAWATCEARMMLAYARTGRPADALASMAALQGFAGLFRMDSPLVAWGSAVYQPEEPINTVLDMWGVPAALLRSVWDPVYSAGALVLSPHPPANLTALAQRFALQWGGKRIYPSLSGDTQRGIVSASLGGVPLPQSAIAPGSVTLQWAALGGAENFTLEIAYPPVGSGRGVGSDAPARAPAPAPPSPLTRRAAVGALKGLLPAGAALWLDAEALLGVVADGAPVERWPNAGSAGAASDALQPAPALRPLFAAAGMGGLPTLHFVVNATFLGGALSLGSESSVFAVARDAGTTNDCCTGVFYSAPGCNGVGTKADPSAPPGALSSVVMIDFSGSGDSGVDSLLGRQAVLSVVYNASGAFSWADGCAQSALAQPVGAPGETYQVGTRGAERGRYFNGSISEVLVYDRALNESEVDAVHAYLHTKWPAQQLSCLPPPPNCTLPSPLAPLAPRIAAFARAMAAAGFADSRYELAHALLVGRSVAAWAQRCAGLNSGALQPLANRASNAAANAGYVASASTLAAGLAQVLDGYSNATDAAQQAIYRVWQDTAAAPSPPPPAALPAAATAAAAAPAFWFAPWLCLEVCGDGSADIAAQLAALAARRPRFTGAMFESYNLGPNSTLVANALTDVAPAVRALGLEAWAMVSTHPYPPQTLAWMRAVFAAPARFIAAATAAARARNLTGFNVDWEPPTGAGAPTPTPQDAASYAAFLDALARALQAEGRQLSVAVAAWSPIWDLAAIGATAVDRVAFMGTYTAPAGEWAAQLALALASVPLRKLVVGLEAGASGVNASAVAQRFAALQAAGVRGVGVWRAPVPEEWWGAVEAWEGAAAG